MKFNYSRYNGSWLDALNLQDLLDRLADFLLNAGFAGGPHYNPWWGWSGDEDDKSRDSLRDALLKALVESGQLTPEMLAALRGEMAPGEDPESMADMQADLARMLDELIEKLMEEGYITASGAPMMPGVQQAMPGTGRVEDAKAAAQTVEFNLTQKGLDFLGYRALRSLLSGMGRSSIGSHETSKLATGVEAEAASKPYEFGDTLNLDIPATFRNAIARNGPELPLDVDYKDLMVHQSEYRSSCATVLMLDISHSMILYGEDRFTPAKRVALALSHLIRTQYPGDTLQVVTFGDRAQEIPLKSLHMAQVGPYHTNTAEGLKLARRLLMAQKKDMRQIVMITDGKPSAITLENGEVYMNSAGLDPHVLRETFREVGACRKSGIPINTFMLARDQALVQFVAKVCEMSRGRAYFTTTMTLGEYVMRDFLRRKTKRVS
ncbi:MAG TPA: VWA domain-containing protein [Longimicrobiales bacterium]